MPSKAKDKKGASKHRELIENRPQPRETVVDGLLFAIVLKTLGGSRFQVKATNGFEYIMSLTNSRKRRTDCWCRVGDVVLMQRQTFSTADKLSHLQLKLTPDELKQARREGSIPVGWEAGEAAEGGGGGIIFDGGEEGQALAEAEAEDEDEDEDEIVRSYFPHPTHPPTRNTL